MNKIPKGDREGGIINQPTLFIIDGSEPIIPLRCFDEEGNLKERLLTVFFEVNGKEVNDFAYSELMRQLEKAKHKSLQHY